MAKSKGQQQAVQIRASDLLYGPKAIAAFLGVPKGIARHLVRSSLIPTFTLGEMRCACRSSIAGHFAQLEQEARDASKGGN